MDASSANRVERVARDRLLRLGEAAAYLSPITGQGNELRCAPARLAAWQPDVALRKG